MTRKSICLLFLVLLALPCFAASKYESKITSLEGEKWWGGAVGLGSKMPFEGDLRLFDLSAENLNTCRFCFLRRDGIFGVTSRFLFR